MLKNVKKDKHIAKYEFLLDPRTGGGIFTRKMRKKLLGILRKTGPGRNENDFWYDARSYAKNGLSDLQLFIEVANSNNINQVFTKESLEPIFIALFQSPDDQNNEPNLNRAEIANLFINLGFNYLSELESFLITKSHQRTIEDARDLSTWLVETIKPKEKRWYYPNIV